MLQAWSRTIGRLPPLQSMVGRYLGYDMPVVIDDSPPMSLDDHARRLMSAFTG